MSKGLLSDLNDQRFILEKQLKIFSITDAAPRFKFINRPVALKITLQEARNFALKEILPTNEIGDRAGPKFEDGKVLLPVAFLKLYQEMNEGGWIAMTEPEEFGGEYLPHVVGLACQEWFTAANFAFMMYPGLAREVGKMLEKFPKVKGLSDESVKGIITGLYDGTYGGTMCLTEPEAGSDVGAIETTAVLNPDNSYTITGSKIFITNGQHGLTENIIHAVLARIEGAPAGTKGISLFLVPRDVGGMLSGSPLSSNNVNCTGIEEKMGIHGNATCSMSFDGAKGWLIGEENKGMRIMFSLMNEARLMVASQGLGAMSAAYQYALDYAKARIQGRSIEDITDQSAKPIAIIGHPDVRRQMMYLRCHVEGCRSLLYWIAYQLDCSEHYREIGDEKSAAKCDSYVDLLTSLAKGVITDRAVKVANSAMQVFGGVGYTKEYPIEQLLRDVRITPIYEGTNGIQAMDFLFRRIPMQGGQAISTLILEIKDNIKNLKLSEVGELSDYLDEAANIILALLCRKPDYPAGYAHVVMDAVGDLLIAWQLLWRCKVGDAENIYTMKFFMRNVLPASMALLRELNNPDPSHLVATF